MSDNKKQQKNIEVTSVDGIIHEKKSVDLKSVNSALKSSDDVKLKSKANKPDKSADVKVGGKAKKSRKAKQPELKFNGHERAFSLFNIIFIAAIFVSIIVYLLVLERPSGFMESENRNYAELPSFSLELYFSGEYTEDVDTYFTDTTPNREELKEIANRFSSLFGFSLNNTTIQSSGSSSVAHETFDDSKEITSATAVTFTTANKEETTTVEVAETTAVSDE
ncbi:MAG: hypothetical protein LIO41_06765 [Ruminococcus sp.]|nr:hypothetical protein [Ruminococcus sp.]